MNIIDAIPSWKGLGGMKLLRKLETWANWMVALKSILVLPMDGQVTTWLTSSKSADSSSELGKADAE
jgi:hypothetical protein